ncbi:Y-family DNA polymerase [Thalassotalea euphylliae]|uniref:Y-family DNA polymerase n=1 Tax=Thalassotalea euphylliae TaxID=1655234 RepID=UPI0036299A4D
MLWLYLYFPQLQLDNLFVSTDLSGEINGELSNKLSSEPITGGREKAIIVVDAKHNKVVQLNQQAKQQGIEAGMGLATACAMCHDLQVLPYDRNIERKQLTSIGHNLYQWVSDIAFDEPDGIYIRIGNMLSLYKSLPECWQKLEQSLTTTQVNYFYATAETPQAAKAIARYRVSLLSESAHAITQVLYQLPVTEVFQQAKYQSALQRLGIKTIEQLITIDTGELSKRFDSDFLLQLGQLTGRYTLPLHFYEPSPDFNDSLELLYEISQVAVLSHPLKRMLNKLECFLRQRNLACQQLFLCFPYREHEGIRLVVHSAEPCDSAQQWLQLIELKLENIQLKQPVVRITLSCSAPVDKHQATQDLFEQGQNGIGQAALVSLLQAKVGEQNVWQLRCRDSHIPEQAQCIEAANDEKLGKSTDVVASTPLIRPSYLLSQPLKVNQPIDVVYGPERIETNWWQRSVVRDYFVGRTEDGRWCWLYRQPDDSWFIQGYFG